MWSLWRGCHAATVIGTAGRRGDRETRYLSLPPPATIFFPRHFSKICLHRVLASAIASFGDMAPVAAFANMSVITYVSKISPSAGFAKPG